MLSRLLVAGAIGVCLLAQGSEEVFEAAPPDVDQALRANVTKFFQAHVDGKFRLAEQVVAEDSKDAFYNMEKTRYEGFDIIKIRFSDNFTKATVVTTLAMEWRNPRVGVMKVKPPLTSLWKVENGEWRWYVEPKKDWETPFGKMAPGPDSGKAPIVPSFRGVSPNSVTGGVKVNQKTLRLKGYEESTATLTATNTMPGSVSIAVQPPPVEGLSVAVDRTTLAKGQTATITLTYKPVDRNYKPAGRLIVNVQPTGQSLGVAVEFAVPPDVQKRMDDLKKRADGGV